jgi:hypothetical protein
MAQEGEHSTNDNSAMPVLDINTSSSASAHQSKPQQPQQLPVYLTNALQSLAAGGQMFPTVDQNAVLMTNAAAAIAAVAASAMSSMNQGNAIGGSGGVGLSPALLAAMRTNGLVAPSNGAAGVPMPSQVASLLAQNGGGVLSGLSLPGSSGVLPSNLQGQLQQLLGQVDTSKHSTPPPPPVSNVHASSSLSIGPSMGNTPITGMQGWSLKQLGTNSRSMEPVLCRLSLTLTSSLL